eukprot:SAG11_NODE_1155_length_5660_cov_6.290955_6_plen_161_part_00
MRPPAGPAIGGMLAEQFGPAATFSAVGIATLCTSAAYTTLPETLTAIAPETSKSGSACSPRVPQSKRSAIVVAMSYAAIAPLMTANVRAASARRSGGCSRGYGGEGVQLTNSACDDGIRGDAPRLEAVAGAVFAGRRRLLRVRCVWSSRHRLVLLAVGAV